MSRVLVAAHSNEALLRDLRPQEGGLGGPIWDGAYHIRLQGSDRTARYCTKGPVTLATSGVPASDCPSKAESWLLLSFLRHGVLG